MTNPNRSSLTPETGSLPTHTSALLGNVAAGKHVERPGPAPEAIRALEEAPTISLPMKVDVLLVSLGEKPATLHRFTSDAWRAGEQSRPLPEATVHDYAQVARGLGVFVEVLPERVVNPWAEYTKGTDGMVVKRSKPDWQSKVEAGTQQAWQTVLVAGSSEDLNLIREGNEHNDARLLGRAYGFPESATDAYLEGSLTHPGGVEGIDQATLAFARYGVSHENGPEEIATARRWSEAVQRTSPRLYQEMLDLAQGSR